MSTDITIFANDLGITGRIQPSSINGKTIATLTLTTVPREGDSPTIVTLHLDPQNLRDLCETHAIPLKDAFRDDDQALRPHQDPYAPREFDDDQWCEIMQEKLTTEINK